MDKKDTLTITFTSAPFRPPDGQCHSPIFPELGVGWEGSTPYVFTHVGETWLRHHSLSVEQAQATIAGLFVLPIAEWVVERDIPCRAYAITGYMRILHVQGDDVQIMMLPKFPEAIAYNAKGKLDA